MRFGRSSLSKATTARRVWTSATALALAAGAIISAPAAAVTNPFAGGGSCYPNQFVISPGAGSATSAGAYSFSESTIDTGDGESNNGAGSTTWSAIMTITGPNGADASTRQSIGGDIGGAITATIRWANGSKTYFVSTCVAEAVTDSAGTGPSGGEMEMEAEGWVVGFPGLGFFPQRAVASLSVGHGDAGLSAKVAIDLGTTCHEPLPNQPPDELAVQAETGVTGQLLATNASHGRWAFPNGFNPGNCEGAEAE